MDKSLGKAVLFALAFLAVCASPTFATITLKAGINNTAAPINNLLLNFSWSNSTNISQVGAFNSTVNITFNLPSGLLYVGSGASTNLTSGLDNISSGSNPTMVVFGNTTTNDTTDKGGWLSFNVSAVAPGTYNITVNETYNVSGTSNWLFNNTILLNINQSATLVTVYLNDSQVNHTSIYPNSSINATATSNASGLYVQLWRNETLINNATSTAWNITQLGVGSQYNFTAQVLGNANYSSSSPISLFWNITQGATTATLYLNNSQVNSTSVYPNSTINATAVSNVSGLSVIMWRNDSLLDNAASTAWNITQLGVGSQYNFTAQVIGNANYSNSSIISLFWNVSKGTLSLSLSSPNVTYSNNTVVVSTESNIGDSDVNYTLYRNNTGLANFSSTNGIAPAGENISLGVGGYIYTFNATGGANWTTNITGIIAPLNVSKGTLSLSLSVPNITYPSNTVATISESNIGDSDVNYTLYRNTSLVNFSSTNGTSSVGETISLSAVSYLYKFNATGGANWTVNATGLAAPVIVSKGNTALVLNITPSSSVTNPTQTVLTGSNCPAQGATDVNCTLWINGDLFRSANASDSSETATRNTGTWVYNYSTEGGTNWTSNYTTLTLTVSAASSGSGNGGGGGPTIPPSATRVTVTRGNANISIPAIAASKMANVTIVKTDGVDFRQINISVVNSVNNIKIVITKLAGEPASVTHTIEGKVYHYIEVDNTNFTDSDVSKVFIKFAVNKTWLSDNGVDKTNVSLYRWANDKWNELPTTYLSEDSYEDFYQTESPGLSYFLIGTSGGEVIVPQAPVPCVENWQCTAWSVCSNSQQARMCTDANACGTTASKPSESQGCVSEAVTASSYAWMYYTIAAIIIIAIAGVLFIFRKKIIKK